MVLESYQMNNRSNYEHPLKGLVCFNFYRGWRGISEYYRSYLPKNVSAQQSYILELCELDRPTLINELAESLEIDNSAISNMLKRMEAAQLIKREIRPENRRETLVFLTNKGTTTRDEVREVMLKADKKLQELIPQSKIKDLMEIVDQVRNLKI